MKQYFAFQWHITDECDQRCKHCYIFSENNCKALDSMLLFVRLKEESIRRLFWHHKEQLQLSCHIIREQFCILSERKIPPCKLIAQGYSVFCYKNGSSSSSVREAESLYRRYSYSSPFSFRNSLNVRISQPRNVWASQRNFRVSFREPWSAFLSV